MANVLLVSKPLVPPWNDSSKNLARDVAAGMSRHVPVILGDGSGRFAPPRARVEAVYRGSGGFAPGLGAQLRVLARLALGGRADLWHFFFAPNPKSSTAGRALARIRRVPTVQTVCSRPRAMAGARRLLFADRTVVLSGHTRDALIENGVAADRLELVAPGVPPLAPLDASERQRARASFGLPDAPLVLFAGDLELGDGAPRIVDAFVRQRERDAVLVMACRAKTTGAAAAEAALRGTLERAGVGDRVRWIGETPRIHALVGAADVVALPSTDLYAKMDLPLVLLEAMWMERTVVVAAGSPAAELADGAAAVAVDPRPEALAAELDALLLDVARREAIGRAARRAAEERYHPDRMVRAYESIYDRLLGALR